MELCDSSWVIIINNLLLATLTTREEVAIQCHDPSGKRLSDRLAVLSQLFSNSLDDRVYTASFILWLCTKHAYVLADDCYSTFSACCLPMYFVREFARMHFFEMLHVYCLHLGPSFLSFTLKFDASGIIQSWTMPCLSLN